MRRSTAAVIGTVAATAVLAAARFGSSAALADGQAAGVPDQGQAAGDAEPADRTPTPTRAPADVGPPAPPDDQSPSRADKKRKGGTAGQGGTSAGGKKQRGGNGGGLTDGTYRGKSVPVLVFGNIQVTLTVAGGRATDITATYPTQLASKDINDRATVVLRRQALKAQSAAVDSVSGATFTSEAYKESLASAFAAARR